MRQAEIYRKNIFAGVLTEDGGDHGVGSTDLLLLFELSRN